MKHVIVLLAALAASGCVSTKNVKADADGLRGGEYKTVTLTSREIPSFGATTAGKATFGLIGAAAMISAGNKIVSDNEVEDPAIHIGHQLAATLSQRMALQVQETAGKQVKGGDVKQIAGSYASSDLVLDVQTINWGFAYFPTDWNNYRVIYSAKLRLVDTKRRKLLAEGFCSRVPEKSEGAPSHEELLADRAARLKSELRIAADQCIGEFTTKVLGV